MRHFEEALDALEKLETPESPAAKTAKTTEAERLGLIATWSALFGYVSMHDPVTGEWHDLQTKDAPEWAVGEARRRKEQYRGGNRRAYRRTSSEMEGLWRAESPVDEGIFEEEISVLKNSSMPPWSPDQGLKDPFSAVFWPWFGGVGFVFDLPTGQIATFSTG